ncbi:MAG: C10 family peptidase [Candidatus Delongbacteria bacterium]
MRICLTLALMGAAWAAPASRDAAQLLADAWLQARLHPGQSRSVDTPLPWPSEADPAAWLVPLAPAGFVLVSADDALRPVLGWSTDGELGNETPPGLTDFLGAVSQTLQQVRATGSDNRLTRPEWDAVLAGEAPASRELGVLPLLGCNWNQGDGWNDLCPLDAAGPGGRVYAGCVAVSMAQIMHYWQQPRSGQGSHGYTSDYGWLQADFSASTYDWEQIPASIPTLETAELLYHCGIAVDMMYAPDGSGAYVGWGNPCARTAMQDHFGFDNGLSFVEKDDMSWSAWRNVMRTELDAGRPILLSGFGSGGHAFNLDGWRETDYFHLNWGWGGAYNGWFLIDQLNPGGSDFSQGQGAVIGLVPTEYQHAPQPVFPTTDAEDVACEPLLFQWSEVPGATGYDLQVDTAPEFRAPLVALEQVTEASRSVENLLHYSTYYWRIRSHGALGTSPWSSTSSFTTAYWDETPQPAPATPVDGALNVRLNPTVLVWDFVTGGASYEVQVDDAPDFGTPVLDSLGVVTHYVLYRDRLEPGTPYWWRVRCQGLAGLSDWSAVRSFTSESLDLGDDPAAPRGLELSAAWPNPFNPATRVTIRSDVPARVGLRVYNVLGEQVAELLPESLLPAGEQQILWQADGLPSGLYLLVLQSADQRLVQKVTLLR